MEFSEEPIPEIRSEASVAEYGASTPFRHHAVIQQYLQRLFERNGYEKLVEYHTTVEKAQKQGDEWVLTLRRSEADHDSWWQERFDALVVCSGHYNVPNLPDVPGLVELEQQHPGTVEHTKNFRSNEDYRDLVRGKIGGPCSPRRTWLSWARPFRAWMRRSTSSAMPRRPWSPRRGGASIRTLATLRWGIPRSCGARKSATFRRGAFLRRLLMLTVRRNALLCQSRSFPWHVT